MKQYLLNNLVCPLDKQPLRVSIFEEKPSILTPESKDAILAKGLSIEDFKNEILEGVLINDRTKFIFPVYHGIPRLLIFEHPLRKQFQEQFLTRLEELFSQGYKFPNDNSVPGEKNVLASFSNEWEGYGYNEEAYWGQVAEVYNNSLLSTLQNEDQNLSGKSVLEVGIGSGGSANFMCKKFDCNLIGVDLGYSVDVAYKNFSNNPFLHVVQASVFNLPFKTETFDFVYSHGVIHHTHSTRKAFEQLTLLPKRNGRLYIWVYSFLNERRNLKRRVIMALEILIRPWCSELPGWMQTIVLQPIVPLYIFHQNNVYKGKKGMAKYSWREALHAARDRFTPKYIHRHTEEEVMEWFEQNNYDRIRPLSARSLPDYGPVGFYMNTGVEGFKR